MKAPVRERGRLSSCVSHLSASYLCNPDKGRVPRFSQNWEAVWEEAETERERHQEATGIFPDLGLREGHHFKFRLIQGQSLATWQQQPLQTF